MAQHSLSTRWRGIELDWRRLLPLAGATLALLLGLFCAWQTWLIARESTVVQQVHAARDQAARELAAEIASDRARIAQVLAQVDPASVMSDPAVVAAALRKQVPQAIQLELYSGNLDEVLHANYREFGYAKAAQLMAAQGVDGTPLAQSVSYGANDRRLSFVIPLGPPQRAQAWVWVELPFAPLQRRFAAVPTGGGRLDLRQGNEYGAARLLSHGAAGAVAEAQGTPVAGSVFNVSAGLPDAFIVLPRSVWLAALLTLLGLVGGAFLLYLRVRAAQPDSPADEAGESVAVVAVPAAAAPPAAPAAAAPAPAPTAGAAVAVDPSIFRAYDIRGVVGKTLSRDVAQALGRAIGAAMQEKGLHEIVVGRDGRLSGPELAAGLCSGLQAAGIDVLDLGAVPTPMVYYATFRYNTGCGVAVTGSHNPPDYNGFKVVVGGETLSGDGIQDLYRRMASGALPADGQGSLRKVDVAPDYTERVVSDVLAERHLKVVVDAGNGIAGATAPALLEGVGCDVIPLYCDVDGSFPNHHPDPSDPANLQDLIVSVQKTGADLGVAFDGDGDRLGVVSRSGEIIYPDRVLMLFARDVLSRQPGATVIYDVKCTSHLKGQILDAGGSPLMWRTGHSLIKAKMRETGAELAGEMSGHFFFKERWYGFDDGVYAAARLLEILAGDLQGRTAEEIFATLPHSVSTPELKIALAEGDHYRFMDKFREQAEFADATLTTIDGVRADWPDGWGLVRASNTTPALVLRFEANDATVLKRIQQTFRQRLLAVDARLKLPF
jgi:phosphomannomutase/phosphoglucomutase